jgi:hypothetical protein
MSNGSSVTDSPQVQVIARVNPKIRSRSPKAAQKCKQLGMHLIQVQPQTHHWLQMVKFFATTEGGYLNQMHTQL